MVFEKTMQGPDTIGAEKYLEKLVKFEGRNLSLGWDIPSTPHCMKHCMFIIVIINVGGPKIKHWDYFCSKYKRGVNHPLPAIKINGCIVQPGSQG